LHNDVLTCAGCDDKQAINMRVSFVGENHNDSTEDVMQRPILHEEN